MPTILDLRNEPVTWLGVIAMGVWTGSWIAGDGIFSLTQLANNADENPWVRVLAALIGAIGVNLLLRIVAVVLVMGSTTATREQYSEIEIMRPVWPILFFNTAMVPIVAGPEPFSVMVWQLWFSFCAIVAGMNAVCTQLGTRQIAIVGNQAMVPLDCILLVIIIAVNTTGLAWILWEAGAQAITPLVLVKWCSDSCKELINSIRLLGLSYLRCQGEGGVVIGRSVTSLEHDVESIGKIAWWVLHLMSSAYVLWMDGLQTYALDIMIYFRLKTSWRIVGVHISKLQGRADITAQIDQLYPQQKLTDTEDKQCAICWETMDEASVLPCGHVFHRDCLRDWVKSQGSCPTCRHKIETVSSDTAHHRDDMWHRIFRRIFSLGGPTPQEIEQATRLLSEMFPHISAAAIEQDLVWTGSVEITADRITRGQVS